MRPSAPTTRTGCPQVGRRFRYSSESVNLSMSVTLQKGRSNPTGKSRLYFLERRGGQAPPGCSERNRNLAGAWGFRDFPHLGGGEGESQRQSPHPARSVVERGFANGRAADPSTSSVRSRVRTRLRMTGSFSHSWFSQENRGRHSERTGPQTFFRGPQRAIFALWGGGWGW
jgi:hypothetical protein